MGSGTVSKNGEKSIIEHHCIIGGKHKRSPRCITLGHLFICKAHPEVWHYKKEECRKCKFIRLEQEKAEAEAKARAKEAGAAQAKVVAHDASYGEPPKTMKPGGGQGKRKTLRTSGYD